MDAFSNPLSSTYLTWSLFTIPLEKGGIQGLAVTKIQSECLNAAYALLATGICGFFWQLIIYLALALYPTEERFRTGGQGGGPGSRNKGRKKNPNRYITLVAIWNAPDPWAALAQLCVHAFTMQSKAKDLPTSYYDIVIIAIALLAGVTTIAAGVIVPALYLVQGAVAPVNPASIFYASSQKEELYVKIQQTKAPSAQRAMGVVEFARQELKQKVNFYPEVMGWTGPGGERIERTTYDYSVTGLDFGLQHKNAANFVVKVKGACTLEYTWFNTSMSSNETDVYTCFGKQVDVSRVGIKRATGGTVFPETTGTVASNTSYAIIPDTVGRLSYSKGTDPWYTTIAASRLRPGPREIFEVDHRRPVLSCWQKDTWTYGGHIAETINDLGKLPGLDISSAILDDLIPDRMGLPMIFEVGAALGNSILLSSIGARALLFDASIANHTADLERLILTSYVSTRNILRDTTMITNTYGLENSARGNSSIPIPGIGGFVITSGEVVSVSLDTLIIVPLLWLLLWVIRAIFARRRSNTRPKGAVEFTEGVVDLSPMQMYALLTEQKPSIQGKWSGQEKEMPYVMREKYTQTHDVEPNQASSTGRAEGEEVPMLESGPRAGITSTPASVTSQKISCPGDSHSPRFTRLVGTNTWSPNRSHLGYEVISDESTIDELAS